MCCRPVNGSGNSWADRVRGVHHAVSVNSVTEVTEDMTESTGPAVSVQPQQVHQQSVVTTPGKLPLMTAFTR